MGSVGDADDNAMAESFFAAQQRELLAGHRFCIRTQAPMAVFDDLEGFYNPGVGSSARPTSNRATSSTMLHLSPDLSTGLGQLQGVASQERCKRLGAQALHGDVMRRS